ncbi:ABC-F family ATP-binding cassette domain-containing protein [Nodosilinea sp. PGN35]|uniref:ABC-F family ATP-binding cassette domain-containing protein n=1 Tax=Nodosilinea sp. PGN35 TaxID=3020489 RepID=UPI0023B30D66|nr:ATP-binding cassette domain-containing protein [Nodosilinea sp. TSF1-S3]MDF0367127.1 ATP-binding cassette domain-containing protein [Nodosilinea sp. TSF1-S3]
MAKLLLSAQGLSYGVDPAVPLFESVHLSLQAGDRTALVGRNGSGKSTLMKLLAGQLQPTLGSVSRYGSVAYVPQVSTLPQTQPGETVLERLSAAAEDWWGIDEYLRAQFGTRLDLALPLRQLSGGELTQLLLAIALAPAPDILLLDEPTNHLDLLALEQLRLGLEPFAGALVLVSHKPHFLDQVVSTVWELTPQGLREYGGNYSLYRQQKQAHRLAAERSHEVAQKALHRAKAMAQAEQKRAARSQRSGRQNAESSGMGKMAQHYFANRATGTAGTAAKRTQAAIAQAAQRVAETKLKTPKASIIQLEETSPKHRTLVDIRDGQLRVGGTVLVRDIQLQVVVGDRVAIAGANGTGKSSLVRAIATAADGVSLDAADLRLADPLAVVYLDQTYGLIDRSRTVLDNMQTANPALPYQQLRQQLGHFLFFDQAVEKPASALSGGELARLALAMISIANLDLLILDEPSNNLDIDTVEVMINAINHYRGALWVISHDLDFLSRIGIDRAFQIKDSTLRPMTALPEAIAAYSQELLADPGAS